MTKPTIARIWRGRTARNRADAYERYLYELGIRPLEEKALGVQLLREDRATETEFVTISYWEDVPAMLRFAGADPTRIHHLQKDAEAPPRTIDVRADPSHRVVDLIRSIFSPLCRSGAFSFD